MHMENLIYVHILGRTLIYQVDWAQAASPEEAVFPTLACVDQITLVTAYADNAYFLVHSVRIPEVTP